MLRCLFNALVRAIPDDKRHCRGVIDSLRRDDWDAGGLWDCPVQAAWQARPTLVVVDSVDADVSAHRHGGSGVFDDARSSFAPNAPVACDSIYCTQSAVPRVDDAWVVLRTASRVGTGGHVGK